MVARRCCRWWEGRPPVPGRLLGVPDACCRPATACPTAASSAAPARRTAPTSPTGPARTTAITWDIEVGAAGEYEAVVYYTCRPEDVGSTVELSFLERKIQGQAVQGAQSAADRGGVRPVPARRIVCQGLPAMADGKNPAREGSWQAGSERYRHSRKASRRRAVHRVREVGELRLADPSFVTP